MGSLHSADLYRVPAGSWALSWMHGIWWQNSQGFCSQGTHQGKLALIKGKCIFVGYCDERYEG